MLRVTYVRSPAVWNRKLGLEIEPGTSIVEFANSTSTEPLKVSWLAKGAIEAEEMDRGARWEYFSGSDEAPIALSPRGKISVSRHERPGQAELRTLLIAEHGGCQITSTKTLGALEACHILPVRNGGSDAVGNALLLRRDLHSLFDLGFLTFHQVSGGWEVRVDQSIQDDDYRNLANIILPNAIFDRHQPYLEARASLAKANC